ncbi:MAG: methyltransferase domain-containing protein [Lachnospiraceae bacterium]|nr:methyltransferase domain-containing protein [Lachnospiraceae bacterium]
MSLSEVKENREVCVSEINGDTRFVSRITSIGLTPGCRVSVIKNDKEIKRRRTDMGLFKNFVSQTRKPEGFLGKMMVNGMNGGHAKMADWGLSHLTSIVPENIVELGCGGGRNAKALLEKYPSAKVTAIDYSEVSVGIAAEYNKDMINAGRCKVQQGDVSALDLPEEAYDLATAFETIYFWPGLEKCFAQVAKVLKPGGVFLIVNESDGTDEAGLKYEKIIDGMKCHTAEEITAALKAAGFSKVKTDHYKSKPWITVIAKK